MNLLFQNITCKFRFINNINPVESIYLLEKKSNNQSSFIHSENRHSPFKLHIPSFINNKNIQTARSGNFNHETAGCNDQFGTWNDRYGNLNVEVAILNDQFAGYNDKDGTLNDEVGTFNDESHKNESQSTI